MVHDGFELTHVEMNTIKDFKSRTSIRYSIFSDIEVKIQTHFCWKSHFIQARNQVEFFTAIVDLKNQMSKNLVFCPLNSFSLTSFPTSISKASGLQKWPSGTSLQHPFSGSFTQFGQQ